MVCLKTKLKTNFKKIENRNKQKIEKAEHLPGLTCGPASRPSPAGPCQSSLTSASRQRRDSARAREVPRLLLLAAMPPDTWVNAPASSRTARPLSLSLELSPLPWCSLSRLPERARRRRLLPPPSSATPSSTATSSSTALDQSFSKSKTPSAGAAHRRHRAHLRPLHRQPSSSTRSNPTAPDLTDDAIGRAASTRVVSHFSPGHARPLGRSPAMTESLLAAIHVAAVARAHARRIRGRYRPQHTPRSPELLFVRPRMHRSVLAIKPVLRPPPLARFRRALATPTAAACCNGCARVLAFRSCNRRSKPFPVAYFCGVSVVGFGHRQ